MTWLDRSKSNPKGDRPMIFWNEQDLPDVLRVLRARLGVGWFTIEGTIGISPPDMEVVRMTATLVNLAREDVERLARLLFGLGIIPLVVESEKGKITFPISMANPPGHEGKDAVRLLSDKGIMKHADFVLNGYDWKVEIELGYV